MKKYQVFAMNWADRKESVNQYNNWKYKVANTYIDLSDDYEGIWSLKSSTNDVVIFQDYQTGYIACNGESEPIYFHNASSLTSYFKNKSDYEFINIKNMYTIQQKLEIGDTSLLTKDDLGVLLDIYKAYAKNYDTTATYDGYGPYNMVMPPVLGATIESKDLKTVATITGYFEKDNKTYISAGNKDIDSLSLLKDYKFLDGQPCGVQRNKYKKLNLGEL